MDVLQGVVDLVAPTLSSEQEKGLVDAIDEADRGDLVDGWPRSRNCAGEFARQGKPTTDRVIES